MKSKFLVGMAALMFAAACAQTPDKSSNKEPAPPPKPQVSVDPTLAKSALTIDGRSDEDKSRDAVRKPVETLQFIGVKPGDVVVELEAGGGYFTTLLAFMVGKEGKVYMQNPASFDQFWGGSNPPRMKILPEQVTYLRSQFDDLSAISDGAVDKVTWLMGPHELWYQPKGATEGLGDPDMTFREIARVLKDGGELIVQDHRAAIGSDTSTGGDTHRIDQNHIDKLAASAGLIKKEESDLFAHPDDDMTLNVFDEAIRGKTDQFLVRYEKDGSY